MEAICIVQEWLICKRSRLQHEVLQEHNFPANTKMCPALKPSSLHIFSPNIPASSSFRTCFPWHVRLRLAPPFWLPPSPQLSQSVSSSVSLSARFHRGQSEWVCRRAWARTHRHTRQADAHGGAHLVFFWLSDKECHSFRDRLDRVYITVKVRLKRTTFTLHAENKYINNKSMNKLLIAQVSPCIQTLNLKTCVMHL